MNPSRALSHRQQGLLLTGGGALIMSPDALLIKLADLPDAEILMWRGFLSALGFLLIVLARHGRHTLAAYRRCGGTGIAVALLFSLTTCGFVLGNQYTLAGNVLLILATSPLIAAGLSWLILKERLPRHTWVAIWVCLAGIAMIVIDDIDAGSWVGNAFAFLAAFTLALNFTLCRTRPGVDMSPMLTFNGLIVGSGASLVLLLGDGVALPAPSQLAVVALLCLVIVPCGVTLLQRGPLYLPAAEVGLLLLLEVVVGTFLAWWIIAEQPTPLAIVGGCLVLLTLVVKGLYERRLDRRRMVGEQGGDRGVVKAPETNGS
ncbi:MAG: DMT family transporter [Pseudomonadota bacterium]